LSVDPKQLLSSKIKTISITRGKMGTAVEAEAELVDSVFKVEVLVKTGTVDQVLLADDNVFSVVVASV
jgi:hypothetical protein